MNDISLQKMDRSLARQNKILKNSITLTPVDSFPIYPESVEIPSFVEGFYATDRPRAKDGILNSKIYFSGRHRISYDTKLIYRAWSKALGAEECSLRLLSGLHAHIVIFMGLGNIGDKVLLLPEKAGGHFATSGILKRLGYSIIDIPYDTKRMSIDVEKTIALVHKAKPDFIFIDRSEGLVYEDFSKLIENTDIYSIFDASQYLTPILTDSYKSPFNVGFNLIISTLHKNFPGPQKAIVATKNKDDNWSKITQAIRNYVSSSNIRNNYLAGYGLCHPKRLEKYCDNMLKNAIDLQQALNNENLPVVKRPKGLATQHIWIQMESKESAYKFFHSLEKCRIHTNFRLLPYDLGYGLRLGTPSATMMGLTSETIPMLAEIISSIYMTEFSLQNRHRVHELVTKMRVNSMYQGNN